MRSPDGFESRSDHIRKFFALFLGSSVSKDGSVKGFSEWASRASEPVLRAAINHSFWSSVKIQRDHRDEDECTAAGVRSLRVTIQSIVPPEQISPDQAARNFEVIRCLIARSLNAPTSAQKALESPSSPSSDLGLKPGALARLDDSWEDSHAC